MSLELLLLMHPGMLLGCSAVIMFLQLMLSFLATRSQVVFWKSFCRQSTSNIQFLCGVGPPQWQDFTLLLVKLREVLVSLVIKQNLFYGSAENCGSRLSTPHRFCGKTWKNIITSEAVSPLLLTLQNLLWTRWEQWYQLCQWLGFVRPAQTAFQHTFKNKGTNSIRFIAFL